MGRPRGGPFPASGKAAPDPGTPASGRRLQGEGRTASGPAGDQRQPLEQVCRPASRGPSGITVGLEPAGFSGRDLAGQIWPPLTLSVSPVGEEMRRPSLPSEHKRVRPEPWTRAWRRGAEVRVERGCFSGPCGRGLAPAVLGLKRNTRPRIVETQSYRIDTLV